MLNLALIGLGAGAGFLLAGKKSSMVTKVLASVIGAGAGSLAVGPIRSLLGLDAVISPPAEPIIGGLTAQPQWIYTPPTTQMPSQVITLQSGAESAGTIRGTELKTGIPTTTSESFTMGQPTGKTLTMSSVPSRILVDSDVVRLVPDSLVRTVTRPTITTSTSSGIRPGTYLPGVTK